MFNFHKLNIILSLWAMLISMPVYGQYSEDSKTHYTVNDGLPSSTCYDLVQDNEGFLWIATEGGLTKYDGQNFKTFTTSNGLADNEIVDLQLDKHDRLWMNTNGPITYIKNDSVHTLDSEFNTSLHWQFKVFEDDENTLWISRLHSLTAYDASTLQPIQFEKNPSAKRPYFIAGVYDSGTWVSHINMIYKYENKKIVDSIDLGIELIEQNPFWNFFTINSSFLYYTKGDMLYKYDLKDRKESVFLNIKERLRQIVFRENEMWLLTENSLNRYSLKNEGDLTFEEKFLEDGLCSKIIFDHSDNMWSAIYKNGLMMFPPENENITTTNFDKLGSNNLESILIDEDKILLGSEKGDIYLIENGEIKSYNNKSNYRTPVDRIIDLVTIKGNGYLISADSGIYHFLDGKFRELILTNGKNIFLKDKKALINSYNRLYEANIDDLLSLESPIKYHEGDKRFKLIEPERSYTSLIDRDNNIWNANVITGLSKRSQDNVFYYKSLSNLFNCTISRLIELESGLICAVTKGEGILLIKDKVVKQIKVENGLSSNFCYDVSTFGNRIFVATNKGVSIIELKDFEKLDFNVEVINMHNGLSSNEVQDIAYMDGELLIATNAGLVEYKLDGGINDSNSRNIFITDFQVNGDNKALKEKYNLKSTENNIRINYISPDISSNENVVYAYQLEGVDEDWIFTTSTETHYSNLEAGKYNFKYKVGSTENGTKEVKSFEFNIESRFVQSGMFKFFILSGIGCLFLLPLYFSYHSQKRNLLSSLVQKKSSEVDEKMRLLELSNARLVSSNKELEQFAYIASHDLQEPINTIKGFGEILKSKFDKEKDGEAIKMLDIISSSSSRMKSLVQDLLVYSRIGKSKKRSMIDINALIEDIMNDMTDRIKSNQAEIKWDNLPYILGYKVELRSLFQNLFSNAMKFQQEGVLPVIVISAREIDAGFEFSVKDNGIGISDKHKERIFEIFQRLHNKDEYEGTGIGLAHCKKIVTLHNGTIWVESELGNGCNFKFTIEE